MKEHDKKKWCKTQSTFTIDWSCTFWKIGPAEPSEPTQCPMRNSNSTLQHFTASREGKKTNWKIFARLWSQYNIYYERFSGFVNSNVCHIKCFVENFLINFFFSRNYFGFAVCVWMGKFLFVRIRIIGPSLTWFYTICRNLQFARNAKGTNKKYHIQTLTNLRIIGN